MGTKGEQTRQQICQVSYHLFAAKGFKEVTMKDICEASGLSRGGLYRHYASTAAIFEDIFRGMAESSEDIIDQKLSANVDADLILRDVLDQLYDEMSDKENSLSLAIYEYSNSFNSSLFVSLNQKGRAKWKRLLDYGIKQGKFQAMDVEQTIDLIVYSYQGVRMWSRVIPISEDTARRVTDAIWNLVTH